MATNRETKNGTVAWSLAMGWTSHQQAAIPLDDLGFLQGAVIVDRLRTCRGLPLDIDMHIARFETGCRKLGIRLPHGRLLGTTIEECANRNANEFDGRDFNIVLLATPGRSVAHDGPPTLIVHTVPIDWQRLSDWYSNGQNLRVALPRSVPAECWSPEIKNRSRLNYFLADQMVAVGDRPYAGAVLLDIHGYVTETSNANLLIVEDGVLISPMLDSILNGVSLQRTMRLAQQAGIAIRYEQILPERAAAASEVLLCGTSGCLWPAASFDESIFSRAMPGPLYCRLCKLWIDDIGLDYVAQALGLG